MNEQIIKAQRARIEHLQRIETEHEKAIAALREQNTELVRALKEISGSLRGDLPITAEVKRIADEALAKVKESK